MNFTFLSNVNTEHVCTFASLKMKEGVLLNLYIICKDHE